MKATLRILATLSLAASSLAAQSGAHIKVTVPFSFVAGAKTLPAGQYEVKTLQASVVTIRGTDSEPAMMLLAHSAEAQQMDGVAELKFNRYGDRYFLSQIWTGNIRGRELPKSQAEREQIAAAPFSRGSVTLAAER